MWYMHASNSMLVCMQFACTHMYTPTKLYLLGGEQVSAGSAPSKVLRLSTQPMHSIRHQCSKRTEFTYAEYICHTHADMFEPTLV